MAGKRIVSGDTWTTASAGRRSGKQPAGMSDLRCGAACRSGLKPSTETQSFAIWVLLRISQLLIKPAASLRRIRCTFLSYHLCIRRFNLKTPMQSKHVRGAGDGYKMLPDRTTGRDVLAPLKLLKSICFNENSQNVSAFWLFFGIIVCLFCLFISQLSRSRALLTLCELISLYSEYFCHIHSRSAIRKNPNKTKI